MLVVLKTLAAAAILLSSSVAQQTYTIDPESTSLAIRQAWCDSQTNQCPLICVQTATDVWGATENKCFASNLTYSCICSNGLSPNLSEYSLTLPYYICTQWGQQCVTACGSDNQCAVNCREQHPCGAQNPKRVNLTTATTSQSSIASTTSAKQTVWTDVFDASLRENAALTARPLFLEIEYVYGMTTVAGAFLVGLALLL